MTENKLTLDTVNDYANLYNKMGCVPYMLKFFHQFDDIEAGPMCRSLHMSKAYAISIGKGIGNDKFWCKRHTTSHSDLILDSNILDMRSICPIDAHINEHPRYYTEAMGGSLVTYNDIQTITNAVSVARTVYFLQFLWNPIVLDYKNPTFWRGFAAIPMTEKRKYITAFIPLLEVDAADLDKTDASKGRYNIFDKEVFEDFKTTDGYIKDRFKNFYGDGNFKKFFSGNGVYYMGYPSLVNSEEELVKTFRQFVYGLCKSVIDYLSDAKLKFIKIDAPFPQWNSYYKIPFTLHKKYNRIAIPLPTNEIIDLEYIMFNSDPINVNTDICEKLWRNANYV